MRAFRSVLLAAALSAAGALDVRAQAPPLVFTVAAPEPTETGITIRSSPVVSDRALALWGGASSDLGFGVDAVGRRWTARAITSLNVLPVGNEARPTFQQFELLRSVRSTASMLLTVGGGVREEWDGTQVWMGRALATKYVGAGFLEGSVVLERATSSPVRRDAADLVTSVGWSRHINDRFALGVEGIGRDLEGFFDPAEADGGAKLLVGPSVQVQSKRGHWIATATAGPVIRSSSTILPDVSTQSQHSSGHHYGVFASASWLPWRR